ncbi:MAG: fimbrillin family protein [Candidatus Cryptobacteroides sp.]
MKKIFILATAAIVAFASCMKTEIVSNSEPQEIAFRQFTGSMTKGETALSGLAGGPTTMGVFAYTTGTATPYFTNAEFTHRSDNKWGGSGTNKYYWPLQDNLDFAVYAPHVDNAKVSYTANETTPVLEVTVDDNSATPQADYLYGKIRYADVKKPETPSAGVSVVLKHALSMVTINVKSEATSVFTVKQIDLLDTYQAGSFTVTYDKKDDNTCTVSSTGDKKLMNYFTGELSVISAGTAYSKLVVPSDQTKIEIKYTMAPSTTVLTAVVDLVGTTFPAPKWETGKHYTYNITLTADEIILVPTVVDWDTTTEGTTVNKEIK